MAKGDPLDGKRFFCLLIVLVALFHVTVATAQESIDLAWDWAPGDSGYTSGPNGDIVYDIYLRTAGDADYAYDYPAISGIDNCWWAFDHYACEVTLAYAFEPGEVYHLVCVAYLADAPTQRSLSSNEISYQVDGAIDPGNEQPVTPASSGGGGGCFISSSCSANRTANP